MFLPVFLIFFGGFAFTVVLGWEQASGKASGAQKLQDSPARLAAKPTGAGRCRFCHPAEVEGYARSAMAHSLRWASQEPDGEVNAHGSKITMHSSPDGYWQHWENGGEASDYRVDFVVGSGIHASGYLVNIGGHLFQSPVAYYQSRQAYDLAPGYENQPDPDFTRPVSQECVLCHSGRALPVAGTLNQYRQPIFAEEAISCERCHGPIERHLADPRPGNIVNPAKLERAARDSICEQCHLFGAARVANPGKTFGDFVPGQRLEETFTIYRNAPPPGALGGTFKVISHVEQLALSACARNSVGKLWCGTCHDPHDKPVQPVQYYRARCLTCHTGNFASSHPGKESDCLSCHMPRRNAQDGGHTVFTDHRIQRRPEAQQDPPTNSDIAAWREPAPELQLRNRGIAYIDVGMQRHSSAFVIQGYRDLTEVQQKFANDSNFFKWIGDALLVGKQTGDAKIAFERALQLDPDSPLTEAGAASPYIQEGDAGRAIAHLERAVALDPLYLPAASTLMELYQKQGREAEAGALASKIKAAMGEASSSRGMVRGNSAEPGQKRTEEVFKNIQILKGVPAGELIPAMEFMASSLGVKCGFCHVEGHFEKDDKQPKQTARKMMRMMFALDGGSFDGERVVTCFSCHRGEREPIGTPGVDEKRAVEDVKAAKLPDDLPNVSQVLEKYVKALGGAVAIEKIISRVELGEEEYEGGSVKVEIFTKAPGKQTIVRHLKEGESRTIVDGGKGWFRMPGRPARELEPVDLEAGRLEADLQFAAHLQEFYPDLRVEYPETIGGREAYVLCGMREGVPAAEFYFDAQTGLLVRVVLYAESPLGRNPKKIDYSDYRDVDGVQIPFRVKSSQPGSRSTLQMDAVRQNVPIEDAIFAKPPVDH